MHTRCRSFRVVLLKMMSMCFYQTSASSEKVFVGEHHSYASKPGLNQHKPILLHHIVPQIFLMCISQCVSCSHCHNPNATGQRVCRLAWQTCRSFWTSSLKGRRSVLSGDLVRRTSFTECLWHVNAWLPCACIHIVHSPVPCPLASAGKFARQVQYIHVLPHHSAQHTRSPDPTAVTRTHKQRCLWVLIKCVFIQ